MFNFFKKNSIEKVDKDMPSFEIELTAAVLAYEIARSDGNIGNEELVLLMDEIKVISNKVGKDEDQIFEIIEIYSNNSISFYEFVEDINSNYSKDEKHSLLKFMWDIAFADGKLDVNEERLIRRLADLIRIKDIEVLKLKDSSRTE